MGSLLSVSCPFSRCVTGGGFQAAARGAGSLGSRPYPKPPLLARRPLSSSFRLQPAAAACLIHPQRRRRRSQLRSADSRRAAWHPRLGGGAPPPPPEGGGCRAERQAAQQSTGLAGRAMSLPPIAPPPAAAPRLQPRKQPPGSPVAAPRRAAAPLAPAKPPRKGRGAPSERSGAFSSSWPSASLPKQQQPQRSRASPGSRNPAAPLSAATAAPVVQAPQAIARGRSAGAPPGSGTRSLESLCAAQGGRAEAALRFSLSLPPEAIRVLQRRNLEKQQRQRGRAPRSASPDAAKRPLAGGLSPGGDLRALLQVSLLNERHRYDDVEYEEDDAAGAPGASTADEGLVRKCTEWLRGVESATARDRADKLDTLPHLSTL